MHILDIILPIIVTIILAIFDFFIKKREKVMLERQENLERYFKPLSLSYGFGAYDTQIPDKDLNFYTLRPFQFRILQGDIKTYSIYTYDNIKQLHGGQPYIPSYEKINHEQKSKDNYGRRMNCLPKRVPDEVYKVNLLNSDDNVYEIEMFAYYVAIEDYTGKNETFLVIYLMYSDTHNMYSSFVIDKFSVLLNSPIQFSIQGVKPTQEHTARYYGTISHFLDNYKDFRQRVKDNF